MRDRTAAWPSIPAETALATAPRTRARRKATPLLGREGISTLATIGFLVAHVPLAILLNRVPQVATVHALAVFALGGWWALAGERLNRLVPVVGYIVGAEVLWRMTDAQVNWEFGKYAASVIFILALLRHHRLKPPLLPLVYFALLLPSVALTLGNKDLTAARNQISFNLSGPFALMMCAWFFSELRLSAKDIRSVFFALIGPVIGIATIAASGTFSGSAIFFSDNSNLATSGGFGPNQVSAILGLGAMLALFIVLDHRATRTVRVTMAGVLVALAVQSALTFSRGGLYIAGGGAAVAACFALRDARLRSRLIPLAVVIFAIGNYFVLPYLDAFTGGEIGTRFQDTSLTGRDRMIQADIELWKENLILGVGPGEATAYRSTFLRNTAETSVAAAAANNRIAHTEFSRLLAEHGIFGLGSLFLLIAMGIVNLRRTNDPRARAAVAALTCWSALFMFSYAMRLFAPSFAFGLGFATLLADASGDRTEPTESRVGLPGVARGRRLTPGHPSLKLRGHSETNE